MILNIAEFICVMCVCMAVRMFSKAENNVSKNRKFSIQVPYYL